MIKLKSQPGHLLSYLRGHQRAFSEGLFMPWKRPLKTLMTLLTLGICFYIPLFLWTLWLNYDELKQSWQNQGTIAIFLSSNIDLKEAGIFMQEVKEIKIVDTVTLLSAGTIKEQLQEDSQLSQIMNLITTQDLPHQISVKIESTANLNEIESFVNNLTINPQVEYVSYDKQWLTQLQVLTDSLLQMARISALMFILIVMVILSNTIANEIIDHKDELRLLELIGASWAQVRRSFLYMGIFFGVIAGLLAVLFLSISFWWFKDTISSLLHNFGIELTLHGLSFSQISLVILISILVTWLAARLSLSSQRLNQIKD